MYLKDQTNVPDKYLNGTYVIVIHDGDQPLSICPAQ